MAITKISRNLLDTGISDSSDATAITINSNEQVGLGTTPPTDTHATWSQFFIGQKGSLISEKSGTGGIYGTILSDNLYIDSDTGSSANIVTNESSAYIQEAGIHKFYSQASGSAGAAVTLSEKMRIASSGNVAIGSTNNGVGGTIDLSVGSTSSSGGITLWSPTNGTHSLGFGDGTSGTDRYRGYVEYAHDGDSMRFATASTERMRINDAGDVLIGGTQEYNTLNGRGNLVVGNGSSGNEGITIVTGTSNTGGIAFADGTSGDAAYRGQIEYRHDLDAFLFHTVATEKMRIASTGQVFVGTTSSVDAGQFIVSADPSTYNHITTIPEANAAYNALTMTNSSGTRLGAITVGTSGSTAITYGNSSDYRLKENIVPMEKGLERVKKLKPVQFNWKDDGFSSEGFIAHEIQEAGWVLGVTGEKDAEEMQMVDYGRITPLLVKAIQEQQEQIEALQSEINTLKGG